MDSGELGSLEPEEFLKVFPEMATSLGFSCCHWTAWSEGSRAGWLAVMGRGGFEPDSSQGSLLQGLGRLAAERLRTEISDKERLVEESRLQDLREFLQELGASISHDIRVPVSHIQKYVELVTQEGREPPASEMLETLGRISRIANRVVSLGKGMSQLAKVSGQSPRAVPVDIAVLLRRLAGEVESQWQDLGLRIHIHDLPLVLGHESRFEELFRQLFDNAVRFRGTDAPVVQVTAVPSSVDAVFSVADNGIGIEARNRERVFRIASRLHHQRETPGDGIGLSLCRRIARAHQGKIWLESNDGGGTRVKLTLPMANVVAGVDSESSVDRSCAPSH